MRPAFDVAGWHVKTIVSEFEDQFRIVECLAYIQKKL